MSRGIFEEVGSLPIVGTYDINFVYDTNMAVYTNWRSDIPKIYAIDYGMPYPIDYWRIKKK
jgi:hypothetical protein